MVEINIRKPNNYWTYENCAQEALKYKTKKEFNIMSSSCYVISVRNGWINNICTHMTSIGSKYKRCIYSYEFSDKHVYIGLTFNIDERHNNRISHSGDTVTKYITKTGLLPIRKQLTEYVPVNDAIKLEGDLLIKYKQNGWIILNKQKTGGIGGNTVIWTKEKCIDIAKKCVTRTEFNYKRGAHSSSVKHGWIDEIHKTIKSRRGGKIKYDKNICHEKALLCRTRKEFKKNFIGEFSAAYKNKWLEDICVHMSRELIWTKERCYKASLNCKRRTDFKKKYKGAYEASLRNDWLNDFFN